MGDRVHYKNATLVGNWYEDRLDKSKPPMPELERTGKYRETPLKMVETTPDMYVSTSHAQHRGGRPLKAAPQPQLLTQSNMFESLEHRTPPKMLPKKGFGAVLPTHDPEEQRRRWYTATHSSYGGQYAEEETMRIPPLKTTEEKKKIDVSVTVSHAQAGQTPGGLPAAIGGSDLVDKKKGGGIRTAGATDERLQLHDDVDPKCHTFVQRSWVGTSDHQEYILRADEYERKREEMRAKDAMGAGLVVGSPKLVEITTKHAKEKHVTMVNGEVRFFKKNDTIKADSGIWNE